MNSLRPNGSIQPLDLAIVALAVTAIVLGAGADGCTEDWPQWRGNNRNAVSTETGLLSTWMDAPPARAWKASGTGDGYSSVVIADGQIFTTGKTDGTVLCFALDVQSGDQRWAVTIGTTSRNVMATPTVHDGLVYALDPDGELVCLDANDGTMIWQRSFTEEFDGRLMSGRGYGESPLVDGDRLICTPGGENAMLVALNRHSGELIWRSQMPEIGEKGRDGAAFSSIAISEAAGVRQYVQLTGRGLAGFEAESGNFLWGYNDISNQTANIPTPLVRGDLVFSANGYHSGAVLLRLVKNSDRTGIEAQEVYRLRGSRFQNHHGGFVLIGNHIYGGHGSNNGLPTCIELQTGSIAWKRRGPGTGSASVVAADGRLYFHYQNGVIALIDASPDGYNLLGQFTIPAGGDSWAHPVIADGKLFIREKNDLWAWDLTSDRAASDLHTSQSHESAAASDSSEPLYRFAAQPGDGNSPVSIVTLTDDHLKAGGSISAESLLLLQQQTSRFILSVAGTRVSDSGVQQIASLGNLAGINMELCVEVTDSGFACLGGSKHLAVLIATGTAISTGGLKHLAAAPELTAIDLEVCSGVTDACCAALGRMTGLRALVLKKTGFEQDRISDSGLKQLAPLQNLALLNLYGNSVTDDGLSHLALMSELQELDLSLLPMTDSGIRHLMPLRRLRRLELLYSEGFAGTQITDAGLQLLGGFTQLTHLNLVGAKISDAGLRHISQLDQLVHLQLTNSTATAEGLQRLRQSLPDCHIVAH